MPQDSVNLLPDMMLLKPEGEQVTKTKYVG
jgi:hypothetical protein